MPEIKKVLAVIPAHNESSTIGLIVRSLLGQGLDVLVVDDNSSDGTFREAHKAGATVVWLPFNLGYGSALQTGYLYAFDNGYDAVVQLDGDGQHDPAFAKDLLKLILSGEADIVMGSRFPGKSGYKIPLFRRLGQKLFGGIVGLLTGQKIMDPTTGYQALTAEVVRIYCSNLFPEDYPDADMRIIHHRLGLRVVEVPVEMKEDGGESMHSGLLRPMYYIYKMTLCIIIALIAKLPLRRNRSDT